MAEEDPASETGKDDETVQIPSHGALPAPPEINFTRPDLKSASARRSVPASVSQRRQGEHHEVESTPVSLGAGMAAGTTFASSIVVGLLIGQWVDHHWNHGPTPWGTLFFALAGMAAGFFNLLRILSPSRRTPRNHD